MRPGNDGWLWHGGSRHGLVSDHRGACGDTVLAVVAEVRHPELGFAGRDHSLGSDHPALGDGFQGSDRRGPGMKMNLKLTRLSREALKTNKCGGTFCSPTGCVR